MMRLWIWRNIRIELPEEWEMLQFSKNVPKGSCAFADRYQIRLEFSWHNLQGAPDQERIVSDSIAKLKTEQKIKSAQKVKASRWTGFEGYSPDVLVSRYLRFFQGESCQVQVAFIWPQEKEKSLVESVLASMGEEPPRQQRLRRWRAFGMDLLASHEFLLHECRVAPASAEMVFCRSEAQARGEERFRRLGMVREWLTKPVEEWLQKQAPAKSEVEHARNFETAGHRIETVEARKKGAGLRKITGKYSRWEASAWICPQDRRLYCMSVLSRSEEPEAGKLAGTRLACCGKMGLLR